VDEQEMGTVEVDSKTLRNLTDVKIFIGPLDFYEDPIQDGIIKELIVLDML